jgi:hypothetical protein
VVAEGIGSLDFVSGFEEIKGTSDILLDLTSLGFLSGIALILVCVFEFISVLGFDVIFEELEQDKINISTREKRINLSLFLI